MYMASFLCWLTDSSCPCGRYTHWQSIGENWFSPSQQGSIAKRFLVGGGALCPPPLHSAGLLSGLDLCSQSLWGHKCINLLCLEDTLSLNHPSTLAFLPPPWVPVCGSQLCWLTDGQVPLTRSQGQGCKIPFLPTPLQRFLRFEVRILMKTFKSLSLSAYFPVMSPYDN